MTSRELLWQMSESSKALLATIGVFWMLDKILTCFSGPAERRTDLANMMASGAHWKVDCDEVCLTYLYEAMGDVCRLTPNCPLQFDVIS